MKTQNFVLLILYNILYFILSNLVVPKTKFEQAGYFLRLPSPVLCSIIFPPSTAHANPPRMCRGTGFHCLKKCGVQRLRPQIATAICGHTPWREPLVYLRLGFDDVLLRIRRIGVVSLGFCGGVFMNGFQSGGRVLVINVSSFGARGALFTCVVATFTPECLFEASKCCECELWSVTGRPYGCHTLLDSIRTTVQFSG